MISHTPDEEPPVVEITGPCSTCRVLAGLESALAPRLEQQDPSEWPGLEQVKSSRVRTISRGTLPLPEGGDLEFHLKLYRAVRLSDRARDAVQGSRSGKEFDNLRAARARGIPCVEPLAAGTWAGSFGSRSFLITRSEPGVSLPRGVLEPERAARAGRLLRLVHDRGLHARDLHSGNLIERPDGSLVILDLTSAGLGPPLELEERARALAYFCLDLDGNVHDSAAHPLVEAYDASPSCLERAARQGSRLRHRSLSAFGRRAFRQCAHTEVVETARGPRWYLCRPARDLHAEARTLVDAPPPPVKSGRRGSVHVSETLVLKDRPAATARRLFRAAYWLEYAGVPTAPPVALRVYRGRGQVVSQRLSGPSLRDELETGLPRPSLVISARALGRAAGRLHAHGLRNRDMKFDNLVRDPSTGEVRMVDLDGILHKAPIDRRGQAADLGRLLAAFRAAGEPGGAPIVRAFLRGYVEARRRLLQPANTRFLLRGAAERAAGWASAHRRQGSGAGSRQDTSPSP